jgi:hypothetical protein
MTQLEQLAAQLDRAISPEETKSINSEIARISSVETAKRRAAKTKRDEAAALALQHTPPPSYEAYALIEATPELADFRAMFDSMLPALATAKTAWQDSFDCAMAHTWQGAKKAFEDQRTAIESAGGNLESTNAIRVRSREDIDSEFRAKASASHRNCAKLAAQIRLLIDPLIQEFANAVENLANKIEGTQGLAVCALGLDDSPSPAVMQLRSGVNLMRSSPHQLSPGTPMPTSIADLVSKK